MDPDVLVLSLIVGLGGAALVANRAVVGHSLRAFFSVPAHPLNLAVFRIVVCATVLVRMREADVIASARRLVDVPDVLQIPPALLGTVVPTLPISDGLITLSGAGLIGGSVLCLVGLWARPAAGVAALSAVYLFGVPNWFGKVNHDHLHLIWFLVLLAVAPSGDALGVQAWLRRRRGRPAPEPSTAHALPLRATWLLLGFVYLSAGLGKVVKVGFDWPLDDNMRNFLWLHWVWHDTPLRIDEWGPVVVAAGFATMAFELGFLPAMFSRRLRPVAAVVGFGFHTSVRVLMGIAHFWTLQAAYVSFVPWERLTGRTPTGTRGQPVPPPPSDSPSAAIAPVQRWVTAALVAAVALSALTLKEQAWPVSAYPSFGYRQPATDSRLEMAVVVDGEERAVPGLASALPIGAARFRFLTLRTLAEPDPDARAARLDALWALARRSGEMPSGADEVRIYRETFSIDPDDDGAVLDRSLEATLEPVAP